MVGRPESLHGWLVPLVPGLGFPVHWVEHFAAAAAAEAVAAAAAEAAAVAAAVAVAAAEEVAVVVPAAAAAAAQVPLTPSEQSMPVQERPNPLGLNVEKK